MLDLETSRETIDELDRVIATAYSTRLVLVKNIGAYKKANNINVLDENREQQVLSNVTEILKTNNLEEYTQDVINLYKYIMDIIKNKQNEK